MSHHIVEAKDLGYAYPDGTEALRGVSFRITHGESVALVGANGAGKSTLVMHMVGFILPAAGSLRVGDYPLTAETVHHIRRTVGMVFQDSDDQLFMPTVFDDVAFGPLNMGLPADEVKRRVDETLETVGASHLKNRSTHRLSGGEKRVVAIAAVLSMYPDILVMDEPSAGLDPLHRRRLIELLKSFRHTKIIATHDLDMAMEVCDRTIVMNSGSVIADGPTAECFSNRDLLEISGLEQPYGMQACPVCGRGRDFLLKND
jgi:cobalt/nickel transport system ATP-binding protein